jgi:hypothetical protein
MATSHLDVEPKGCRASTPTQVVVKLVKGVVQPPGQCAMLEAL